MAILIIVGALILFYIVIKVYECYYYKKIDNEIPREIQISQNATGTDFRCQREDVWSLKAYFLAPKILITTALKK